MKSSAVNISLVQNGSYIAAPQFGRHMPDKAVDGVANSQRLRPVCDFLAKVYTGNAPGEGW